MRVLAVAAASFSAAVFISCYLLPVGVLLPAAAALALLGAGLLLLRRKWLRGFAVAAFALCAGLTAFFIRYSLCVAPAERLADETVSIEATVTEYPKVYPNYSSTVIRLKGNGLPHIKVKVYDYTHTMDDAVPGQTAAFTAKLRAADTRYGEEYDYYYANGIYLTANTKSDVELSGEGILPLWAYPQLLNRAIISVSEKIFDDDTLPFMKSLMLGDKSDLYQRSEMYSSLNRAGLMHIVAVSGMHIAFLVGFLQLLLGKNRLSGILCILIIWVYALVAGAGVSIVRAAFMQTFLLLAPLLRRENDPITSLSAVLAIILIANPYAAGSVSLQLSFAAMAGIICFARKIRSALMKPMEKAKFRRAADLLASSIAGTLGALVFTIPLTALHFGQVSILSPLTNLLTLWMVAMCFGGGYIACLLGALSAPVGIFAGKIVCVGAKYVLFIAKAFKSISFATVYLQSRPILLWLIITYVLIVVISLIKAKKNRKILIPTLASVVLLALALILTSAKYGDITACYTAVDVGQGQSLAVMSGENTVVIDCGGKSSEENAGEAMGEYLLSRGRDSVDLLVLTHLHADHANGVKMLMSMVDVERVLMPEKNTDDDDLYDEVIDAAKEHSTEIIYAECDCKLNYGKIALDVYSPGESGDKNERCIMLVTSVGYYDMLVTADASIAAERELLREHSPKNIELLIVGHHGSKYSSCEELLESIGADTAIISVGYNTYGHPTEEVLELLRACGYNIYRTDVDGTVEIKLD